VSIDRAARADEVVLIRTRPGLAFVFLHRQGWWLVPAALLLLAHSAAARMWSTNPVPWMVWVAVAWLVIGLAFRLAAWWCRSYVVTERRVVIRTGVLSRAAADVPRFRIQHTTMTQSPIERLLGLGTIGVSTADGPAVNLLMVPNPHAVLDELRRAPVAPAEPARPVIGLAGGIGSGKSEVARILHSLGCLVIDSDKEAKEALDRPPVRDQLVKWWGASILKPEGKVDRKAVANIIFKNDKDRAALEALVHPLVRAHRAELKRSAAAAGAPAVVIDAPLLFEAGVDGECDAVIFVDASREKRLERVKAMRGWDEAEFDRRERAQLPLDEKRRRSTFTIRNEGIAGDMAPEVQSILERLKNGHGP
jgi:dephospho-CoA kinase